MHATEHDALRLAAELYGLRVTARALPGEYDDNFHLIGEDGRAFVLKVMRVVNYVRRLIYGSILLAARSCCCFRGWSIRQFQIFPSGRSFVPIFQPISTSCTSASVTRAKDSAVFAPSITA